MPATATAFKLLCDPEGRVFGVEAGDDQYIENCETGDVFGTAAESIQVSLPGFDAFKLALPGLRVSEVKVTDANKALACCWRIVLGRWQCVAC